MIENTFPLSWDKILKKAEATMGLTTHRVGKKLFIIRKTAGLSELKELSYKPWHALTVPRVFRENVLTFKSILFKASNKSRRVSRRTFISEFHCWRI